MAEYAIRCFTSVADAGPQYELWLRATESLPRAWRSCLRNVQSQLEHCRRYPKSRLYAERMDGRLLGYIGTHPPFNWIGSKHGPPARSLGWAIPFGFPWTCPVSEELEASLYDEMIRVTPEIYAGMQRDIYIQRFRESWSRPLEFLRRHGWRLIDRVPLIGMEIDGPGPVPGGLTLIERNDMALVSALCAADDTASEKLSTTDLQERYDGGWIVHDTFWKLGERGAFALEQRGSSAAVTAFYAHPDAWHETMRAVVSQAYAYGAREIYFTVQTHESQRRRALHKAGCAEVDAGVYYVRDAD